MSDRIANVVIVVVLSVWVVNMVAAIFQVHGYQSDPIINGIFMGTVGLAFTSKFRGKNPPHDGGDHRAP